MPLDRLADRQRRREERTDVRDIAELYPAEAKCTVKNPNRRRRCKTDLKRFLLSYFKPAFYCGFGSDHNRLIETTQRVCLEGGRVIAVLPRGSGKTTIFQRAVLWATLYGHSRFCVLIAADDTLAKSLLAGIKSILESSTELAEDFPEVTLPIRALEGAPSRAMYQLWEGKPTRIKWTGEQIHYGTIKPATRRGNAGAVIRCTGLTAAMRGLVVTTPDGQQLRPDFTLIDDPQTKKSAHSPAQCQTREDIMNGDIAGMAGVSRKMSMMCAATVIERDDLVCRLIDRDRSPDWVPIKVPMLYSMPTHMDEWAKYNDIRIQEVLGELDIGAANEYYLARRETLDEGAEHYWPDRIDAGAVSAIQSAMNAYLKSPRAFASECQGEPEDSVQGDLEPLKSIDVVKRQHPEPVGVVPTDTVNLVAHIDVQLHLLYWTVVGWRNSLGGYVVDYGTYPEQPGRTFDYQSASHTLQRESPGNDDDGAIVAGLEVLLKALDGKRWRQGDGEVGLSLGMVDARYKPECIERAIQRARVSNWLPSYGVGIGAKNPGIAKWVKKEGARHGVNWVIQKPEKRRLRSIFVDTNFWKSQAYGGLKVPVQHPESITLYSVEHGSYHQMFADHCTAEYATRVEVESRARIVDEWDLPSHGPDNHFWDNLVSTMAGASTLGLRKVNHEPHETKTAKRPKIRRIREIRIK